MNAEQINQRIAALEQEIDEKFYRHLADGELSLHRQIEDANINHLRRKEDIYRQWSLDKDILYYTPKLYGHNPLTGLPVTVVFNEPAPGRSSLMNWNPLLKSWMYSGDAGLTWQPVNFMDYLDRVDMLWGPEYDGK